MFGENWEYKISFTHRALKQLKAFDKNTQVRLKAAINKLKQVPSQADVKKLKAIEAFRLREGKWRVLFEYDHKERVVLITGIYLRKEAYQ